MPKISLKLSLILLLTFLTSSCLSVSDQDLLLSSSREIRTGNTSCTEQIIISGLEKTLNNTEFTLVSWNIYKQNKEGWDQDLLSLSKTSDLILLQEAYLTQGLKEFLQTNNHYWDMVSAFRYHDIHAGVMTVGKVPSQASCAQRTTEPLLFIPKSSLITYYPISNTEHSLLVANIHAINFTLGIEKYNEQLQKVKTVLTRHQGPIVFAGDFNTWSDQREVALDQLIGAEELGLLKVEFVSDVAMLAWGHRLDHVFFRGLKVINAEIIPVDSSDHSPLKVQFEFIKETLN